MSENETERGDGLAIRVTGYDILRASYNLLYVSPPLEEQVVRWKLLPGLSQNGGQAMVIGDLTSRSEDCFAGVQAAAYLSGLEDLKEGDWSRANEIVTEFASFATDGLYDFAAQTMRAMTSGAVYRPPVPSLTPAYEIDLASTD